MCLTALQEEKKKWNDLRKPKYQTLALYWGTLRNRHKLEFGTHVNRKLIEASSRGWAQGFWPWDYEVALVENLKLF